MHLDFVEILYYTFHYIVGIFLYISTQNKHLNMSDKRHLDGIMTATENSVSFKL